MASAPLPAARLSPLEAVLKLSLRATSLPSSGLRIVFEQALDHSTLPIDDDPERERQGVAALDVATPTSSHQGVDVPHGTDPGLRRPGIFNRPSSKWKRTATAVAGPGRMIPNGVGAMGRGRGLFV